MNTTISSQIKTIREKNNLSQSRFGKKIGITGKAVSAYETGRAKPSLKVLENISAAYNVSFTSLTETDRDTLSDKLSTIENTLNELKSLFFEYSKV